MSTHAGTHPQAAHAGGRRRSLLRAAAFPATVAIVLLGVWITGGLVTNDFALAMWLSAGWMAAAGVGALAIAVGSRALRWPVLAAYALTAAVLGVYLGSSVFLDKEVNETVATASARPAPATKSTGGASPAPAPAPAANVLLRLGTFQPVRHAAAGEARAIELAEGGRVLTLTRFDVDNGPDLRVYLVAGPATTEGEVDDLVDLGALKGNKGDQQYAIPTSVDLDRYSTVVIWCRAFSVLFARAPLRT